MLSSSIARRRVKILCGFASWHLRARVFLSGYQSLAGHQRAGLSAMACHARDQPFPRNNYLDELQRPRATHFHARYGDFKAIVAIEGPRLLAGTLPPRVAGLVVEWATLHRTELIEDWQLAMGNDPPKRIAGLE